MSAAASSSRVVAVDAFRGYAILNVIFFNDIAGAGGIPGWMDHAPDGLNYMTYVDIGVASFLLIVGMSIPLAVAAREHRGETRQAAWQRILFRSLALILMGTWMVYRYGEFDQVAIGMRKHVWGLWMYFAFFLLWFQRLAVLRVVGAGILGWLAWHYHRGMQTETWFPQWWGILGQIGWGYLIVSALYLTCRPWLRWLAWAAVLGLPGFYWLLRSTSLAALPFSLDFLLDSVIVLFGAYVSQRLFLAPPRSEPSQRKFAWVAIAIALAWALGQAYTPLFGISKNATTPAYTMFGLASGLTVFIFFFILVDGLKAARGLGFLMPAARNPLTLYLLGEMSYDLMRLCGMRGHPSLFADGLPRILYAAIFTGLMLLIITLISRRYPRLGF